MDQYIKLFKDIQNIRYFKNKNLTREQYVIINKLNDYLINIKNELTSNKDILIKYNEKSGSIKIQAVDYKKIGE